MDFIRLLYRALRFSTSRALKEYEEYEKKHGTYEFSRQQQFFDILAHKDNEIKRYKEEAIDEFRFSLVMMTMKNKRIAEVGLEGTKGYPMVLWMEIIGSMDQNSIKNILNNFGNDKLPSMLLENFIMNLEDSVQSEYIRKYKSRFDTKSDSFKSFYYCLCDDGRKTVDELFPGLFKRDVLAEVVDTPIDMLYDFIKDNIELFREVNADDLMEALLKKMIHTKAIAEILELLPEKCDELSDGRFKLFITRCRYARRFDREFHDDMHYVQRHSLFGDDVDIEFDDDDDEEKEEVEEKQINYTDEVIFERFKARFRKLGLKETLSLFELQSSSYYSNDFSEKILIDFISDAYDTEELRSCFSRKTILSAIAHYSEKLKNNTYSVEDFRRLVSIAVNNNTKLMHDDVIEAMIACGQLMKEKLITDKDPDFIALRDKFISELEASLEKDDTLKEPYNFNAIFYRLLKGVLPYETVYGIKKYKGLIYLTRCGIINSVPDSVTEFVSDYQVANLDFKPLFRWKKELEMTESKTASESFIERMSMQLLIFFGEEKAKYILTQNMKSTQMEALFDRLRYGEVVIDENGKPVVNTELNDFLFGRGSIKEPNSIMNKTIRDEMPEFKMYFTDFCNNYFKVKTALSGILSPKRIIAHYEDIKLPVELKPDQYGFKKALKEIRSMDEDLLQEAADLLSDAARRTYSTIPKVKGTLGAFTYEIMDLDNPEAIDVGYWSHCCFQVRGISYSALKHSLQSVNGRTFVVYYKGQFLCQSWVWRNGDVVCFDSVEAGGYVHGSKEDRYGVVDVYKRAAEEIYAISKDTEDDIQRVKAVTVGRADYRFDTLEEIDGKVARPLEEDVYVYDSRTQSILAGKMPKKPRYDIVGAQYQDERKNVVIIDDIENKAFIDDVDEAFNRINKIRYLYNGTIRKTEFYDYKKMFVGNDWYVAFGFDGKPEIVILARDERAIEECKYTLQRRGLSLEELVKKSTIEVDKGIAKKLAYKD